MNITYVGTIENSGAAYPIINRNITNNLFKMGHKVANNFHTLDNIITPLAIAHEYPPRPLNLKHAWNVCFTAWEFAQGFPRRKIEAINTFDLLGVPSEWVNQELSPHLDIPVKTIRWGYDFEEYTRYRNTKYPLEIDGIKILWIGGTDKRHGFDVALKVLDLLPENYFLIAKQGKNYPKDAATHPRLHLIYEDIPSLYPLYNACDLFLQSGRGVGFSLPTLEALVVGLPVVSTDLPPIHEFKYAAINFSHKGQWQETMHHLYTDCYLVWFEPDVEDLAKTILTTALDRQINQPLREHYNWCEVTKNILETVNASRYT